MPDQMVVFGDSQAEGVVVGLRRVSRKGPAFTIANRAKAGTAIGQPPYDWPAVIAEYAGQEAGRAPVAICLFGGNDRLPMRPANAPAMPFRSGAWETVYRERVSAMMASLAVAGVAVLWLGEPMCREARYSGDMAYLNGIYEDVAKVVSVVHLDKPAVRYMPLWDVVSDGAGHFAAYGQGPEGKQERLRLDDGIHFTPAGYELVAQRVMTALLA